MNWVQAYALVTMILSAWLVVHWDEEDFSDIVKAVMRVVGLLASWAFVWAMMVGTPGVLFVIWEML